MFVFYTNLGRPPLQKLHEHIICVMCALPPHPFRMLYNIETGKAEPTQMMFLLRPRYSTHTRMKKKTKCVGIAKNIHHKWRCGCLVRMFMMAIAWNTQCCAFPHLNIKVNEMYKRKTHQLMCEHELCCRHYYLVHNAGNRMYCARRAEGVCEIVC